MLKLKLSILLAAASLITAVQAQSGFVADALMLRLCLAQNWNSSQVQSWLEKMPEMQRKEFGDLELPSDRRRCLIAKQAAPAALCQRVIDQLISETGCNEEPVAELSSSEKDAVWKGLEKSGCLADDIDPEDAQNLAPDPATLNILERAAKGELEAQLQASALYFQGDEVPEDKAKAEYWLAQAANAGDPVAQFRLGALVFYGAFPSGVDVPKALRYLKLAADQGHRPAMTVLAHAYLHIAGTEPLARAHEDEAHAVHWYERAHQLGDPDVSLFLARYYSVPDSQHEDMAKAFYWYQKSADGQNADSMVVLSQMYQHGEGTSRDAQAAQYWRRKADALGVNGATLYLVDYFPRGDMPRTIAEIARIQLQHAKAGDVDAQLAIAWRFFRGEGVKQDAKSAARWWRKAAMAGDPIGQRMLGKALQNQWGTAQPHAEKAARDWLKKAAVQGDTEALVLLAYSVVDTSVDDAVNMLREAADRGYRPEETRRLAEAWQENAK